MNKALNGPLFEDLSIQLRGNETNEYIIVSGFKCRLLWKKKNEAESHAGFGDAALD